jgi:hypothetical protein
LDCNRFSQRFGQSLPDWTQDMALCLDEVLSRR